MFHDQENSQCCNKKASRSSTPESRQTSRPVTSFRHHFLHLFACALYSEHFHYYIYFEAKYVLGSHIGSFPLASSSGYRTPSVAAALIHILTSSPLLHNIGRKSNGPRKDEFHTIYYSQTKNYTTFVHIAVDPCGCGSGTYVHASTTLNACASSRNRP